MSDEDAQALRDVRVLICDNMEQLLPVSAEQVLERWLELSSETRLLVTSREKLRVAGERVFVLEPLTLPEPGGAVEEAESVQLFLEYARRRGRAVVLEGRQVADVVDIVKQLDGIPLAIELAAVRTQVSVERCSCTRSLAKKCTSRDAFARRRSPTSRTASVSCGPHS